MLRSLCLLAAICAVPTLAVAQLAPVPPPTPAPPTPAPPPQAPSQPSAEPQQPAPAPQQPALEPAPQPSPQPGAPAPVAPPPQAAPVLPPSAPEAAPSAEPAKPASEMDPRPVDSLRYVPGKGFEARTQDGDFALALGAWMQTRFTWNGVPGPNRYSVEIAKARLVLGGHLWGPDTRYQLELGLAAREIVRSAVPVDGEPSDQDVLQNGPVLNAYLDFKQLRDLSARVGQFKVPFSRQQLDSEPELAPVERALTDSTFALGRDIGLDLYSDDLLGLDLLRYHVGIYGGEGRNAWQNTIGAGDEGFLYDVRIELLPFGVFDEFTEVDFERGAPRLSIGTAYALLQADATSPYASLYIDELFDAGGAPAVVDFNAHNFTADAIFMVAGLSAQTAFHLRKVTGVPGGLDGIGFMIAANYLLQAVPLAPGASFAMVRNTSDSPLTDGNELVLFASWYFAEHLLKVQLDYSRLFGSDGIGEGSDRVRLQLQGSL